MTKTTIAVICDKEHGDDDEVGVHHNDHHYLHDNLDNCNGNVCDDGDDYKLLATITMIMMLNITVIMNAIMKTVMMMVMVIITLIIMMMKMMVIIVAMRL